MVGDVFVDEVFVGEDHTLIGEEFSSRKTFSGTFSANAAFDAFSESDDPRSCGAKRNIRSSDFIGDFLISISI